MWLGNWSFFTKAISVLAFHDSIWSDDTTGGAGGINPLARPPKDGSGEWRSPFLIPFLTLVELARVASRPDALFNFPAFCRSNVCCDLLFHCNGRYLRTHALNLRALRAQIHALVLQEWNLIQITPTSIQSFSTWTTWSQVEFHAAAPKAKFFATTSKSATETHEALSPLNS